MAWASITRSEEIHSATVATVDGPEVQGALVAWNTKFLILRHANQQSEYPASELLNVAFPSHSPGVASADIIVELIDGARFPATSFEVEDHVATIETPLSVTPISISNEQILHVVFSGKEHFVKPLMSQLEPKKSTGDLLVISKKDSSEVNSLIGVINDITAEQVSFTWEGETIPVKLSKVVALSYYHSRPTEYEEPVCWLHLENGFRLPVAHAKLDGSELDITTSLRIDLKVRLNEIQSADYSMGKLAYLSDLDPLRETWTPLIELPTSDKQVKLLGMPRRDASFDGSPLMLSWPAKEEGEGISLKSYSKGLALRSRTNLEYRLPRGMRRLVTTAGIDPETLAQGNVLLSIAADGETLFQSEIDGSQPPINIDVDIADKRQLEILVDYGSNLDLGDRLHLAEARLVK